MDRQTGKFTRYKHKEHDSTTLTDDRVSAIMEDSRGVFWIGTAGDGLHTMDRSTGLFKRLRYDPAKPGNLSRSQVIKNENLEDLITFITEDATGIIWIGTLQGGLSRYDPGKGNVIHYNDKGKNNTALFKDKMFCRFTSRDGLLWMSTWKVPI
jgi:ligand-binding sensor domain-containing protein